MKKDIEIPEVKDVYIAIVKETNTTYNTEDWNAYIINDKPVPIEMILIVSSGYNDKKTTVTFRKKLDILPAKSYAKIELLTEELFKLNNEFKVTFFENNKLLDKTYIFKANTVNEKSLQPIPLISALGILAK